jgi:cyclic pyranopterin phosphate synthase
MVDVSDKSDTIRIAKAVGSVQLSNNSMAALLSGNLKKGDALAVARIAGIMAAKKTSELIPLCHPLFLSKISVDLSLDPDLPGVQIQAKVKSSGQTGVEMEALTAVSIAGLTVYDMMKAVDKTMEIGAIRLKFKDGGKSGRFEAS